MPAFIDHTPDQIARARTLYEDTAVSPHDVARILGLSTNTFYRRVKGWGWKRRRLRVAEVDAAAREAARSRDAAAREVGERVMGEKLSAFGRARAAAISQLDALRATQERVSQAAAASVDGERSARALGHLARALLVIEKGAREEARAQREEAVEPPPRRVAAAAHDADVDDEERELMLAGGPAYAEFIEARRRHLADRLWALIGQDEATGEAGGVEQEGASAGPDDAGRT